jgi:hypothetical protein
MRIAASNLKQIPLDIVGSTMFGRYPKISIEQTFNMIISDDWLVPSAGYKTKAEIADNGEGRAIFASNNLNQMVAVIDNGVYLINENLAYLRIGTLETSAGDVFIDENNAGQIAICDKSSIYIYNYNASTFQKATLDFLPGYVAFQDGYFIAPDLNQAQWRLSDPNNGASWPAQAADVGAFQTKPNKPVAALRFPGKGNLLLVFGSTVTELWYDLGYQLFPYQKNSYMNIDYGCLNPATIAASDKFVVWLAANEKSGPVIMYTDGSDAVQISNDGINFKFAQLSNPSNSYGFLFKQDGHLIYQLTFPDDNFTIAYDFNTEKLFTLTDEYMSCHIAKRVVYFNNSYYFVSLRDGNVYELNSRYTTYDDAEIPRVRVCKNIRLPDSSRFVVNNLTFTLEQGEDADLQRIDFSFSIDGGNSFTSYEGHELNAIGRRQNRIDFWNKGMANDFVPQFRFWGTGRFVATNGLTSIYQ